MLAGAGASIGWQDLFARPAGSRGQLGGERSHLPGDGGAVSGERRQCREVVATLARERQRGNQADWWEAVAAVAARARVAAGADRREAGPDVAGGGGRVGRARHASELRGGVALLQARGEKTLHASEQDRADIARRRTRWKAHQGRLDPKRLVFIDETPAFAVAGSGPRPI